MTEKNKQVIALVHSGLGHYNEIKHLFNELDSVTVISFSRLEELPSVVNFVEYLAVLVVVPQWDEAMARFLHPLIAQQSALSVGIITEKEDARLKTLCDSVRHCFAQVISAHTPLTRSVHNTLLQIWLHAVSYQIKGKFKQQLQEFWETTALPALLLDENMVILRANPAFLDMTSLTEEAFKGKKISEFIAFYHTAETIERSVNEWRDLRLVIPEKGSFVCHLQVLKNNHKFLFFFTRQPQPLEEKRSSLSPLLTFLLKFYLSGVDSPWHAFLQSLLPPMREISWLQIAEWRLPQEHLQILEQQEVVLEARGDHLRVIARHKQRVWLWEAPLERWEELIARLVKESHRKRSAEIPEEQMWQEIKFLQSHISEPLVKVDFMGRILTYNKPFADLFRLTSLEEALGKELTRFLPMLPREWGSGEHTIAIAQKKYRIISQKIGGAEGYVLALLIALPQEQAAERFTKPDTAALLKNKPLQKPAKGVLVIDDEEYVLDLLKELFAELNIPVYLAENGMKGLEVLRQKRQEIGLVLLDVIMPEMDGKEAFFKLKQIKPDVKVLLTSGYSRQEAWQEIFDAGVEGYIRKPFDINELLVKVDQELELNVITAPKKDSN